MPDGCVRSRPRPPVEVSVKRTADQLSFEGRRPAFRGSSLELFVQIIKTDRSSDEQAMKAQRFFRKRKRPDQGVDDIETTGVAADKAGRAKREQEKAKRGQGRR